jgi:hypothetical protein
VFALLKAQEQQFGEYMAANPHMTLLLKYNDYVTDHDVFRRLFDFLEEPYDAELVKGVMSQELTHAKFQAPSDGKKG